MKNLITIAILCLIVLLGSCVKEEFAQGGTVVEGEPAILSVEMKGGEMMNSGTKSLTDEQEKEIRNIHVMIFDSNGKIVTNEHFDSYANGIVVSTTSGNGRTIYVVANGDAHTDIDRDLASVTTLSDLDDVIVANTMHDMQATNGLIMSGQNTNVNINPGESSLSDPIRLYFLSAKITLKVVDATPDGQSVQILGWDVVDAPTKCFLTRHETDAVDIGEPSDFFTTDGKHPFETKNEDEKSATHELYLFENRRGKRIDRSLPEENKRYTGMDKDDGDDRGKTWYAPPKATHILIHAMHTYGSVTEQIIAKIYIGDDNHSDYNVVRGNNYIFTITVRGLNDIMIDSNVNYAQADLRVDYGTNLVMDAHPDFRPIRLQSANGFATIEILDEAERTYDDPSFNAKWLKISPLNLMYHQVRQAQGDGDWQQDGEVGDFVRAKYIPHKSVRETLSDKKGWNTIPIGMEDDDKMSFDDATYRMCYKITDIPFTNVAIATAQILCVYADEYVSDIEGTRTAKVKITYLRNGFEEGAREETILDITQRGPMTIFDMDDPNAGLLRLNEDGTPGGGVKHKFVVEQFEESSMVMNPGIPLHVQGTTTMQFGFYWWPDFYDGRDKFRNGYFMTANKVYADVQRTENNEPINFGNLSRPKFGKGVKIGTGQASVDIPNYGSGSHTGYPYFYPVSTANIYHPIYKSSSARYCHEKNRDLNGDGTIDASETKWYMPAYNELIILYAANDHENFVNGESNFTDNYASVTEINITYNTSLKFFGLSSSYQKDMPAKVLCIMDVK